MESKGKSAPSILFLNTGANHNLGDRAMLLNVVRLARERLPNAELIVEAGVPDWMIEEFGLTPVSTMANCLGRTRGVVQPVYALLAVMFMLLLLITRTYRLLPTRSMEFELMSALDRSQSVWLVGGGYLNDKGAIEARSVLWTAWLGQRIGRKVVMTGQGIGPFTSIYTLSLFRSVAARALSIVLREPEAGAQVVDSLQDTRINFRNGVDDAISLPAKKRYNSSPALLALHFRRSSFHSRGSHLEADILQMLRTLINKGERVKLFVFSERKPYELELYEKWRTDLGNPNALEIIQEPDPRVILSELRACQCAIGTAYHFHLFSLLSGIPSLAMYSGEYYESKYRGIDMLFKQSRSFVDYSEVSESYLFNFITAVNRKVVPDIPRVLVEKVNELQRIASAQILETLEMLRPD